MKAAVDVVSKSLSVIQNHRHLIHSTSLETTLGHLSLLTLIISHSSAQGHNNRWRKKSMSDWRPTKVHIYGNMGFAKSEKVEDEISTPTQLLDSLETSLR